MRKKLLSAIALFGFLSLAAQDPVDITANYFQNYIAPFETTGETLIGDNTRWQLLGAPWVTENNLGTQGVDYTAWHVDFEKMPYYPTQDGSRLGVFTLTPGWDGFANTFSNMKAYQTATLPAGNYELIAIRAQDWSGAAGAHLVVAEGEGIPTIENIEEAIGSVVFSTAMAPEWTLAIPFKLTRETKISIGAVASYTGAQQCVTLSEFRLMSYPGLNFRPLEAAISRYKAYTTSSYPVIGTYAEEAWNKLQDAITEAEAFVELAEGTEAELDDLLKKLDNAAQYLRERASLPRLLATAKNMTPAQYPIGIIMGTYPQDKWDALQATIITVEAFVANSTVSEEDIETNSSLLQNAIDELNGSMVLPFKISTEEKSFWYQVRDQRSASNYWHIGELYKNEEEIYPIALILAQVGDNTLDEQLFKFEKAPAPSKGYYISSKVAEDTPLTGSTTLNVAIVNFDSLPTAWQFGKTISPTNFTVFLEGKINLQLNSYANYSPPYVGFYYPGAGANDFGNNWEFIEVIEAGQTDFSALKTLVAVAINMISDKYPLGEAENQFSEEKWINFTAIRTAAIDMVARETGNNIPSQAEVDAMLEALQQAINELNASQNPPVLLSTDTQDHWYMIHDNRANNSWWKIDSLGEMPNRLGMIKSTSTPVLNDSLLFKFKKADDPYTGLLIYSKLDATNALSGDIGGNFITFGPEYIPTSFVYSPTNTTNYYLISVEDAGNQLNSYAGYDPPYIAFWNGGISDPGNNWRFIPTIATSLKNTKAGELEVYVVNRRIVPANRDSNIEIYSISGQRIKANTELAPGIYIVKETGKTGAIKVMVH
jgi:hypothetical protein